MKNRISATIVADSINEFGNRCTTYVLVFPRIVLAEFNTHRMLSKNSASSRAIPFATMVQKVKDEPFIPIAWQTEHKGMQGTKYLTDPKHIEIRENQWLEARDAAVRHATILNTDIYDKVSGGGWQDYDYADIPDTGITKQLCNRLLEPFLYHTVICTGTEWENFFALRAHPDAEIHIADLAEKMLVAYNESTPKRLKAGEWHIPFGDRFDNSRILEIVQREYDETHSEWKHVFFKEIEEAKVKIATARCARISYLNFEGKDDYNNDLRLYNQLLKSGHMSPFEHCAQNMTYDEYMEHFSGRADQYDSGVSVGALYLGEGAEDFHQFHGWSGNFKGFIQHRKMLEGENKTDNRVIKNT